ncbi:restriction endonuclease subunit S [Rhizobium leguminosarum bv. viciae]|uniref:restriction endonuclease subunit S n=1 Tax=Rhizobium leguminosarum TaxID=384 RepID=UPI00103A1F0E|nr:restriction endonuclease subunit S [Rhizobium leguminosarum]TBZ86149.1 restriction endonuclease subunit S [Rhizobium leguminosarum bv. viciae]
MSEQRLGDLIEIKHGYAFSGQHFCADGPFVLLTPGNFYDAGGFKFRDEQKHYDGAVPSDFILKEGDLLVAMTEQGEGLLGSAAFVPGGKRYLHNQRLGLITPKAGTEIDLRYVYYLLNSRDVRLQIRATASGAKVRHTSPNRIYAVDIPKHSLPTQRRIASILGAYDDLIEVNRHRISALEEMARGLFDEWFVRFRFPGHEEVPMLDTPNGPLPEGWSWAVLGDVVEQRRDTTGAGEHLNGRAYIPIECITRRSLALDDLRPWQEAQSSLQLFSKGDILFGAMRAYFHKVAPAPLDGVTRSTCFVLRPRSPSLAAYSLQALFRDETVAYASAHSKGSTIPYAQWAGVLERMPCLYPDAQTLERFQSVVQPMVDLIVSVWFQARNLAAARDLLLPRLISGKLSVAEAERELEEAA